jgi:hypothetical protein
MKETINKIEEKFFKHVAVDEQDLDIIKARGEANMQERAETPSKEQSQELPEGNYSFKASSGESFPFKLEAGGIMEGETVNGQINGNRVLFRVGDKDYEGKFINPTTVEASWKDGSGASGNANLTLVP